MRTKPQLCQKIALARDPLFGFNFQSFPKLSVVKNLTAEQKAQEMWGRSPGGGNGNPLQYSGPRNPMDRGAWWATVHGVAKESDMTEHIKGSCEIQGNEANSWH